MLYLFVFAASFANVGLRATQQLNVQHSKYGWVMPTSMSMAVVEVAIVVQVINEGVGWIILPIGLGSGLGCLLAMWIHRRIRDGRAPR